MNDRLGVKRVEKLINITGKALSGEWGIDDEEGIGISVLRTTNFTNDGIIDYSNVITRTITKKNIADKFLRKGDIIIEKSGGSDNQPVGRVVYFDNDENKYLFNNFTGLLRVKDTTKWLPKYIFYSLFANYQSGGTRRYENKTTGLHNLQTDFYVKDFEIKETSYSEQIEICELFDKITDLIDKRKKQLKELDELVKSRFVEMFGDIHKSTKWEKKPWAELVTIQNGRDYKNIIVESGGYPVYGTGGEMARASDYLCPENTIIIGRKGTINNPLLVKEKFWNVDTAFGVMVGNKLHYQYFYNFCRMFDFSALNKQAVLPSTTKADLLKIEVAVPPIELQNQFAAFVKQVDKSKLEVQKSLEKLEVLKKALMQKYFG